MKQRTITGLVMAVVLVPIFIIGNIPLMIVLGLLSLYATYEIYHLSHTEDIEWLTLLTNLFFGLGMYLSTILYLLGHVPVIWPVTSIIVTSLVYVYYYYGLNQSFKYNLIASLYPSIGFATLFAFRESSLILIGFVFLITVSTDIFAYMVGINFGKHKLAPKISPKKSWEGSIGGTTITVILAVIYIVVFNLNGILSIEANIFMMIVLTILISIFGQIGDLVASQMKRNHSVKDFSQLFPGHGGVMDRFDSVLFVGVVMLVISEIVKLVG